MCYVLAVEIGALECACAREERRLMNSSVTMVQQKGEYVDHRCWWPILRLLTSNFGHQLRQAAAVLSITHLFSWSLSIGL
jgi:hypothetical protein